MSLPAAPSPTAPSRRHALALGAAFVWPLPAAAAVTRVHDHLFGSPVTLLLGARSPAAAVDAVRAGLARVHRRFNAWKPGELLDLNQALAERGMATVSPTLAALLRGARQLEGASDGCFNAAIGGLVAAWGFHADTLGPGPRPRLARLQPWLEATPALAQLQLDGLQVHGGGLRLPRLRVDLGGYAKGAAADAALDRLQAAGVSGAVVDLGGNLAAMGDAGGRPWRVGLRDPLGPGWLAQLAVQGREAVVTSGTYERFRLLDGERASHVIDPRRGVPAAALVSATVVHPSAAWADGAATALLVAGPRRWRAVAQRLGVDQVLVVDPAGRAQVTPALAARLQHVDAGWRARIGGLGPAA